MKTNFSCASVKTNLNKQIQCHHLAKYTCYLFPKPKTTLKVKIEANCDNVDTLFNTVDRFDETSSFLYNISPNILRNESQNKK